MLYGFFISWILYRWSVFASERCYLKRIILVWRERIDWYLFRNHSRKRYQGKHALQYVNDLIDKTLVIHGLEGGFAMVGRSSSLCTKCLLQRCVDLNFHTGHCLVNWLFLSTPRNKVSAGNQTLKVPWGTGRPMPVFLNWFYSYLVNWICVKTSALAHLKACLWPESRSEEIL